MAPIRSQSRVTTGVSPDYTLLSGYGTLDRNDIALQVANHINYGESLPEGTEQYALPKGLKMLAEDLRISREEHTNRMIVAALTGVRTKAAQLLKKGGGPHPQPLSFVDAFEVNTRGLDMNIYRKERVADLFAEASAFIKDLVGNKDALRYGEMAAVEMIGTILAATRHADPEDVVVLRRDDDKTHMAMADVSVETDDLPKEETTTGVIRNNH
jgi:hypothetical protein